MSNRRTETASKSPLFQTKDERLVDLWDVLQRYQTDFCFAQELPQYYTFPQWEKASSVVDVGTGNGYYLNRIFDIFPTKHYLGIDHSEELLRIAGKYARRGQVEFVRQDLWKLSGIYDFAIVRLVLQHVPDVAGVLTRLANIVRSGGGALIVDAHDPLRFFAPPLPIFMQFFEAFRLQEQRAGPDKTVTSELRTLIEPHPDWCIDSASMLTIPSSIPGNIDLFRETYRRVIDMVELVGEVDFDFDSVRKEWEWWCGLDIAYTQVGLNVIKLVRM